MDTNEQLTIGGMWEPTDAQRNALYDLWIRWMLKCGWLVYGQVLDEDPFVRDWVEHNELGVSRARINAHATRQMQESTAKLLGYMHTDELSPDAKRDQLDLYSLHDWSEWLEWLTNNPDEDTLLAFNGALEECIVYWSKFKSVKARRQARPYTDAGFPMSHRKEAKTHIYTTAVSLAEGGLAALRGLLYRETGFVYASRWITVEVWRLLQLPDFEIAAAYCDNYKHKKGGSCLSKQLESTT